MDAKHIVKHNGADCFERGAVFDDLSYFDAVIHVVFVSFLKLKKNIFNSGQSGQQKKTGKAFAFSALCAHFITLPAPVAF